MNAWERVDDAVARMKIAKTFRGRLKRLREKMGLTQEILAKKIDLWENQISLTSTGKHLGSWDVIEKINNGLKEFENLLEIDQAGDKSAAAVNKG